MQNLSPGDKVLINTGYFQGEYGTVTAVRRDGTYIVRMNDDDGTINLFLQMEVELVGNPREETA
jgi:hypothetical protein